MKTNADVVIIGGGIIGCATAYYLAKQGCKVTVLEKDESIGNGGSSRNGGGVRQSGRDKRELSMMMYGVKHLWPGLSDELGVDTEYCRKGNLRLGKNEAHRRILQTLTDGAVSCGVDVRMIDGEEARRINPYLSEEVVCASWCPTDGHANPLTTTLGYYRKARQLGVRFITGQEVTGFRKIKGRIAQVITKDGVFETNRVLLAAGMDSRRIAAAVGIDVPMTALKMETLVTEAMPRMFDQMLGTAAADFYGHQTKDDSFVFGGSSGYEMFAKDNGTPVNTSITAGATCRGIMGYFPLLKHAKIVRTWGGWIDQCADGVPVMSTVEEVPGLTLACGFSGHGFGIAPAAGYFLAQLIAAGKSEMDLRAFRYDRFAAKI